MKAFIRAIAPLLCCASWTAFAADPAIDSGRYIEDVKFLASPQLRGRATGSAELEKAAAFIAGRFREFGVKPAAGNNYLQAFTVTVGAEPGKGNRFRVTENGKPRELRYPADFTPINISSSGKLAGTVVFAGYGITAPAYKYDDYANLHAK